MSLTLVGDAGSVPHIGGTAQFSSTGDLPPNRVVQHRTTSSHPAGYGRLLSIGRMNWTALVKLTLECVERTERKDGQHFSGAMAIAAQMFKHPGSIFDDPVHRPGDL